MLLRQLSSFYPLREEEKQTIDTWWEPVLEKMEYSFSHNRNKYYWKEINGVREVWFDALHSCQWLMFLYRLGNTIFYNHEGDKEAKRILCDKIYGLSKTMSGADLYYEIQLPEIFTCDHPVGSAMGRAVYGDHFSFTQGCTVGNNRGIFPHIGEYVSMKSNSKILGNSRIGDHVIISANSYVKDQDVPSNSIVFGSSPNLIFKENHLS